MNERSETQLGRILREEGRKQAWLAEQVGVSRSQMHYIVGGLHVSDDLKTAIAAALQRPTADVFPPEVPA